MKHLLTAMTVSVFLIYHIDVLADDVVKFIPLDQYMADMGKDPLAISYVTERCAGLYVAYGKNLAKETDPERQRASETFLNVSETLMGYAINLNSVGTSEDRKTVATNTAKTVTGIGNIYVDRIEQARFRTNNAFDDPLIASDMATCKLISAGLSSNR